MKQRFEFVGAGIDDEIIAVGEFQKRGASAKQTEGMVAGQMLGALLPGHGDAHFAEDMAGMVAGQQAGARAGTDIDGYYRWLLAVSPTKLYILVSANPDAGLKSQAKDLMSGAVQLQHTYDRDDLEITVKARYAVRLLILDDHASGDHWELEGYRHGRYRARDVFAELLKHPDDDHHPDDAEADVEAEATSA